MEILSKILLGITLAAPIGPVSVEMIKRGLKNGFLSAFIVRLGAAIGNFTCLVFSYYGLLQLKGTSYVITTLSIISSLILIKKGYIYLTKHLSLTASSQDSNTHGIMTGLYLSIANPIAFIFWSGIITNSANAFDTGLLFNSLIIVGVIIWGAAFSAFLSLGKKYVTYKTLAYVNKTSGAVMLYFGLTFLGSNLQTIFTSYIEFVLK